MGPIEAEANPGASMSSHAYKRLSNSGVAKEIEMNGFKVGDSVCWKSGIERYGKIVYFKNGMAHIDEWDSEIGDYVEHAVHPAKLTHD
jgi:hypothetical protein